MVSYRRMVAVVLALSLAMVTRHSARMSADEPAVQTVTETSPATVRSYDNRLKRLSNPTPLLADHPEYVQPVREIVRYEANTLVNDQEADLSVRAWRFSYNARGIIEMPNYLRADRTAVIMVHPWGIDDGQGWRTPEPAGVADFCTLEKKPPGGYSYP